MKIKILYEDKDVLVIDKPSGMSVHPAPEDLAGDNSKKSKKEFITDWVLKNYPKMKNVGEPAGGVVRPGVVHRLDRDTSGVLVLAKNASSYTYLKKEFQERKVKKTYVAIVSGVFKNEKGVINKPIGRSPKDFRRRLAGRGARGEMREAVTEYKVLKNFNIGAQKYSFLEIHPKTGRTHQIRVHMKFINHPVVCDSLYAPDTLCPKGITRMALHAHSIEFSTLGGSALGGKGFKSKIIKVVSPIPLQFRKACPALNFLLLK